MSYSLPLGKPVTGKDMVGREPLVRDIVNLLKQGQSVVLVGPRRIGKTSVMLEALSRMKRQGYFTLHTDVFTCPTLKLLADRVTSGVLANRKLEAAFAKVKENLKLVLKNTELRQVVEDNEFILGFAERNEDGMKLLGESISFMDSFARRYDKSMVAGFDEFGDIDKYNGGSVSKLFRSKLQLLQNTACIFAGSYESVMNELFVTRKAPFFRFARIIPVGPIPVSLLEEYIKTKLGEYRLRPDAEAMESLLAFTEGHPYYTQLAIQQLILSYGRNMTITKKQMSETIGNLLFVEAGYLEKSWEELIARKENVLVMLAIAQGEKAVYSAVPGRKVNVARSISYLQNTGLVAKANGSYYITDPLLKLWINLNILHKTKTV